MTSALLPPEQDWRLFLSAFFLNDFWDVAQALHFLEILEQQSAPEFWGPGEVIIGKYNRADIQRYLLDNQTPSDGRPPLQLKRTTAPRYRAVLNVGNAVHPHSFHLTSDLRHEEGELPDLFTLGDALASSLDLEFATIDVNRAEQDPATRMLRSGTSSNLDIYLELGFYTIFARSYFGDRVVRLAGGSHAFHVEGAIVRFLKNHAVALDLHPTPWLAKPEELKATQLQVLPMLRDRTGLFYATVGEKLYPGTPGRNWKPPPGARWPA
jgi:hypothetical protein